MTRVELASLVAAGAVGLALTLSSGAPRADTADVAKELPPATAAAARAAGREALALVAVPAGLGYRIEFMPAASDSPRAQVDTVRRRIAVFVRAGDSPHRIAHDIAHEYGHAWDAERLGDASRAAYLRSRGAPSARWWPPATGDDYSSGAGDFAEVFAACRAASPEFRSRLAPAPADPCAALPSDAGAQR